MSYSSLRITTAITAIVLAAFLLPGCSDDECPSCLDGGSGGARLTIDVMHPQPTASYYRNVWAAGTNDVFFGAVDGLVLRRHGSDWINYDTRTGTDLLDIWGTSASNVFAVGYKGQIAHFDGADWTTMSSGVLHQINAVWGPAPDTVYAVGSQATLLRYDGTGWSAVDPGLPTDSRDLRSRSVEVSLSTS